VSVHAAVRQNGKLRIPDSCRSEWIEALRELGPGLFDKRRGMGPDEMATTLGFDSEDELREALVRELRQRKAPVVPDEPTIEREAWTAAEQSWADADARTVALVATDAGWSVDVDGETLTSGDGLSLVAFLEALGFIVQLSADVDSGVAA
jgi:hypothetical protein